MKKIIFLIFLFICPKVYAKECVYDKTYIFDNGPYGLYTKIKIDYTSDIKVNIIDSIDEKYKFIKEGGSIRPALYNKETDLFDKVNSDTEIYNMITTKSFNKAYEDSNNRCPYLMVYQRKLTVVKENTEVGINGEIYSKPANNSINYYECTKSISTKDIPNINGTTIRFKLYNNGSKYICILPVFSGSSESCSEVKGDLTNVTVKQSTGDTVTFQLAKNEYDKIYKDITNNKFTCPKEIYVSRKQVNANLLYLSTNKEDAANESEIANDKVTSTNDGKAEDYETKGNVIVFRIRKPNISINLDLSTNGCEILGKELTDFLIWTLDILRIMGIVLSIVLGSLDYVHAIMSNDNDALNKANKNLYTRVIVLIILFIVPVIVEFSLTIIDIAVLGSDPSCGIY